MVATVNPISRSGQLTEAEGFQFFRPAGPLKIERWRRRCNGLAGPPCDNSEGPEGPRFRPTFLSRCSENAACPRSLFPKHSVEFIEVLGLLFFTDPGAVKGIACQLVEVFAGDWQVFKECAVIVVHVPAEIGRVI